MNEESFAKGMVMGSATKKRFYEIVIRESNVDSIGHLNNATYLVLFEEARWEWLTEEGYGFREIQKSMQGPVILDIHIKFLKEIRLRDKIKIASEMMDYEGKIAHLKQVMLKDNGDVACEAIFTFGLFDMKNRKIIEPSVEWKKALGITTLT